VCSQSSRGMRVQQMMVRQMMVAMVLLLVCE
jgi:hypothetical protein